MTGDRAAAVRIGVCAGLIFLLAWGQLAAGWQDLGPTGADKLVHFSAYAVLGIALCGLYARPRLLDVILWLAALGAVLETGQFVIGRDASLADQLANVAGASAGAAMHRATHFLPRYTPSPDSRPSREGRP